MHNNCLFENSLDSKYLIITLIASIIISTNLIAALPLEHSTLDKGIFDDSPAAVGVIVKSEHDTIEYTNKILLKEDSIYEGRLGVVNANSTLKFGLAYQAIYGAVEIDETTGEFCYVPHSPNFRGPDSFGYFVSKDNTNLKKKPKHKQIFVSVKPISGCEAFKKAFKQPLWGFWHYINCIRCKRS